MGVKTVIYLDNAATSFPKPEEVYEAMLHHMKHFGANPGRSGHKMALEASRSIYRTRELLGELFHINNVMQIIFVSNATEALNLGIKGVLKSGDHVITSSMEHNSILRPIKTLEKIGVENTIIQCNKDGSICPEDIKKAIKSNTKLVVLTHASNVTGTIMPIVEIGKITKEAGILFLVDAAQTAGIYDINVDEMNIDILAMPGHKGLMGPQGTGVLYIREGIEVMHSKEGGTGSRSEDLNQPLMLPDRYESGTPNTPGIVGLGAGVQFILNEGLDKIRNHEKDLTGYFIDQLEKIELVHIYGPKDANKQGAVVSINIGDEDSSEIAYILDKIFDIGIRPGLHCASMAHKTIGSFEQGTVRFSIGYFNTREDIDKAIEAIKNICSQME